MGKKCCTPQRGPREPVRGALFPRSSLAEFAVGARSCADDPECCCVGRAWHGRAAAGGRVALGRAVPKRGILYRYCNNDSDVKIQSETTVISILV